MDKYDEGIEFLQEHPTLIAWSWTRFDPLFQTCSSEGYKGGVHREDGKICGCLPQIREGGYVAELPSLTREIRADKRLPTKVEDITLEHLPVFAEWQRRLDRELGR